MNGSRSFFKGPHSPGRFYLPGGFYGRAENGLGTEASELESGFLAVQGLAVTSAKSNAKRLTEKFNFLYVFPG